MISSEQIEVLSYNWLGDWWWHVPGYKEVEFRYYLDLFPHPSES